MSEKLGFWLIAESTCFYQLPSNQTDLEDVFEIYIKVYNENKDFNSSNSYINRHILCLSLKQ